MKNSLKHALSILAITAACGSLAQQAETVLFENFENIQDLSALEGSIAASKYAKGKISSENAISGGKSLELNTLGQKGYPQSIEILPAKLESGYLYSVKIKYKVLRNHGNPPSNYLLLDLKKGKRLSIQVFGTTEGESGEIKQSFRIPQGSQAMLKMTSRGGSQILLDDVKIERIKMPESTEWLFAEDVFKGMKFRPTHPNFLKIDSPELKMTKEQFFPFIDKFGQYKHRSWPHKLTSEADFAKRADFERDFNASLGKIEERGKYFGLADASHKCKATGRFYTKKIDGKWWLVTPDGNLFWSHGIDTVGIASDTPTTGREHYFEDISDKRFIREYKSNKHSYAQGKVKNYDFGGRNLTLKYGEKYGKKYAAAIAERLAAWGINTCGAWTTAEVMRENKIPYTFLGNSYGAKPFGGTAKLVEHWAPMVDYFEPEFEIQTRKYFEKKAEFIRSPYCIGVFSGNELPWQNKTLATVKRILSAPQKQAAKIKFLSMLQQKYGDIESLNAAWKSGYKNWEDFLKETNFVPKTDAGKADMLAIEEKYYERYFQVCREAVKAVCPDALYLGCRFAWSNELLVKVASRYCDVVSFNWYHYNASSLPLPAGSADKPIIIGEFHFGNQDRGVFGGGLRPCATMKDRINSYEKYVESALKNPAVVGAHWFRWFDQMATGRGDGENYSVGFVDICDTPIYPMVAKAHELSQKLYDIRLATPPKR